MGLALNTMLFRSLFGTVLNIALKVVAYGVYNVNGRVYCVICFEVVHTKLLETLSMLLKQFRLTIRSFVAGSSR